LVVVPNLQLLQGLYVKIDRISSTSGRASLLGLKGLDVSI